MEVAAGQAAEEEEEEEVLLVLCNTVPRFEATDVFLTPLI